MNQSIWKIVCLISIFSLIGCGGGEKSKKETAEKTQTIETFSGADPSVLVELGGAGFEEIAEKLGYQTYVIKPDEEIFFGDPRAVKGGTLRYITSRFPATMRILGQNYNYSENIDLIIPLCYESLLGIHPVTLEFIPSLATHWKISEDEMQFWFRINPNARWSDGMPVVAEDVVATWDLHMDETILMPSDQLVFGKFERPVAESKYIVSVKSKELNWRNFLYFGGMRLLPAHYLKDLDGTDYLENYQYKMLPGTGPYEIRDEDIINQESFTFTRRPDYWDADSYTGKYTANFDKIKVNVVKDNLPLVFEKFKKGEQDIYTVSKARVWMEECDFESIKKGWIQKRRIYSERPAGTSGYAFNMRKWPFYDRRVRYAFTYLYNREKMNREMYYNEYSMMNSLYSGSVYENPNNEKISYNPEKAVRLLNEAGYTKRNREGWLVHEETGRVLKFEIAIQKGSAYMVTPVQQMLKDYGIDMQIKFMDGNTMWKNLMERNFTIYMQAWGGLVFPNPETSLHSSLADKSNNNNISGFKNERVDALLDEYDECFNQQRRIEIIREIDSIYSDIHPAAWGIARNYWRLLFWDKFDYPEWMLGRYVGEHWDVFKFWWIDPEKEARLEEAMTKGESLPQGELDVLFWPEYLKGTGSDE